MTKIDKIYYNDVYREQFEAVVLDVAQAGGAYRVVLDATCFYPEGGGQPADHGILGDCRVVDCRIEDDVVYHFLEDKPDFGVSDVVAGKIDWPRRFGFMQNHTGEHLLSGLAKRWFGATNVGFHMSERGFTIDFDVPLSWEQLVELETSANELAWADAAIKTHVVAGIDMSDFEARAKRVFAADEVVRIVEIPELDICACAGLHVRRLGEVGLVKITAAQRYKGGTRINVYCGRDAMWDYTRKNDILRELSGELSAETDSIIAAVGKLKDARATAKKDADALKHRLFAVLAERVAADAPLAWFAEDGLDADDLRRLAGLTSAAGRAKIAIALSAAGAVYKYAACAADGAALGDFAAKLNAACDGKGGVSNNVAQGALKADFAAVAAFLEGWT